MMASISAASGLRDLPGSLDVDCIAGRVWPPMQPNSSAAHLVHVTFVLVPRARCTAELPNTIELAKCNNVRGPLLLVAGRNGHPGGPAGYPHTWRQGASGLAS